LTKNYTTFGILYTEPGQPQLEVATPAVVARHPWLLDHERSLFLYHDAKRQNYLPDFGKCNLFIALPSRTEVNNPSVKRFVLRRRMYQTPAGGKATSAKLKQKSLVVGWSAVYKTDPTISTNGAQPRRSIGVGIWFLKNNASEAHQVCSDPILAR